MAQRSSRVLGPVQRRSTTFRNTTRAVAKHFYPRSTQHPGIEVVLQTYSASCFNVYGEVGQGACFSHYERQGRVIVFCSRLRFFLVPECAHDGTGKGVGGKQVDCQEGGEGEEKRREACPPLYVSLCAPSEEHREQRYAPAENFTGRASPHSEEKAVVALPCASGDFCQCLCTALRSLRGGASGGTRACA